MANIIMTWQGSAISDLQAKVAATDDRMKVIIGGQFLRAEGEAVDWMKPNAPWTDRTGNARSGLNAHAEFPSNVFELVLAHSMWYGIFLELTNSGRYSILVPAMLYWGDELMKRISSSMKLLGQES